MNQNRSLASLLVPIALLLVLSGLVWGNIRFAGEDISGEGFSVQWIAVRSLLTAGMSPYSDPVTAEIQKDVPSETSFAPGNPPRYTTPIFSGIVVFPFAMLENKSIAHGLWLTLQLLAIFGIVFAGMKLTSWKPAWYIFLLFLIFTVAGYHVLIPWLDGGLSIWAALFLILAFLAISYERNELAGVLLALSTIQPQMLILILIFTIIWAATQHRRLLILWFFITLVLLSILGLFIAPDWILQYLRILAKFQQNFPPGTLGALFTSTLPGLGKQLGWLLSGIVALILVVEWRLALTKDFRRFLWTACLTLVLSQWIGIPTIPANFIALIIPALFITALFSEQWRRGGQWVAVLLAIISFIWQWATYYRDLTGPDPAMQLNLLIPLPLVILVGLYWVRWWAFKPRRLLIEELKFGEPY